MLKTVIDFLRSALSASDIGGGRHYLDVFADRLTRACAEPTLDAAMESLLRGVQASLGSVHPPFAAAIVQLGSTDAGDRVLAWLRANPRLAAMLAATKDREVVDDALSSIELPPASAGTGAALPRGDFDIQILVECTAALAHGAEGKAGNATLFRRMDVLSTDGSVLRLPYYAGNAVRGQMRDLLADDLLELLDIEPSRSKPKIAMWLFYALYSGGALEEKSAAMKAVGKELGNAGSVRGDGIRRFRSMLPAVSLLGCALGNRVLPGRIQVADLRPRCIEWGTGDAPVAQMLTWEFLTRREDHEAHEEHHGMIASTEVLRAGTCLEGGIDLDHGTSALERGALGRGLELLEKRGYLGAENRRGLGRCKLSVLRAPSPDEYVSWVRDSKGEILDYLRSLDGLVEEAAA